jgi:ABC-2 type transport system ATP-binding protein
MPNNIAINIEDLYKTYNKQDVQISALDGISLQIPQGSFFGLLGANGAGKSTLINVLADLVKKDSGTITVFGQDFDLHKIAAKYNLGIVPQELVLDPFFTVRESLEIFAGYYGLTKAKRRTDEIIEILGLQDKANAQPRSLSGGMRRRLLVAKALVHDPKILILDEPTAGVDIELKEQLWDYVKKINNQGKTIILTTHYLEEAEKLCDNIAFIDKGKIVASDSKDNLKKLFGKKKIIIEFANNPIKLLQDIEKYGEATIDSNTLTLQYKTGEFNYLDFINLLAKKNLQIQNIKTQETDVEDIFKNLIIDNK